MMRFFTRVESGWPGESFIPRQGYRGQTFDRTSSAQKHCRWCRRKGILYEVDYANAWLGWRNSGFGLEEEIGASIDPAISFSSYASWSFYLRLAEKDFHTAQHFCGGWRGSIKGVSAHTGWSDRELYREEAVKEGYGFWLASGSHVWKENVMYRHRVYKGL